MNQRKQKSSTPISNLDKYMKDLQQLIDIGGSLSLALENDFQPDHLRCDLKKRLKDDKKVAELLRKLPSFSSGYQTWYSEALLLIDQLLPNRLADFTKLYERPRTSRRSISSENYVIEDALQGLTINVRFTKERIVGPDAAIPLFRQQLNIVKSVKRRFESSLFDIKQLVQADVFDSELEAAAELNKKGFTRAAGALAGVVLEGHLLQVVDNHKLVTRKKAPGINDFAQLLKDSDVIDTPAWRFIQHLADIRNLCDHKKKREPKNSEIDELILGVSKTIKTLF